ncbi:hypothetical protein [Paenibacillus zanthoxyli]|uniref:hypothetical protein n=1 Tax=Paenibacillus zanthoxyli TaxID=369399 RepID=UPI00047225DB|nr:hypothetical protein [Paenibacillus zanthoxyli]
MEDHKTRFSNGKLYVLIDSKLVIVLDASKKIQYSIDNVWDYSSLHFLPEGIDFESFDYINAPETGGYFFKESDLNEIFRIIKTESPY